MLRPRRLHERRMTLISTVVDRQVAPRHSHAGDRLDLFLGSQAAEARIPRGELRQRPTEGATEQCTDHHHPDLQAALVVPGRQPAQADAYREKEEEDEFSHIY